MIAYNGRIAEEHDYDNFVVSFIVSTLLYRCSIFDFIEFISKFIYY